MPQHPQIQTKTMLLIKRRVVNPIYGFGVKMAPFINPIYAAYLFKIDCMIDKNMKTGVFGHFFGEIKSIEGGMATE